jgi:hypothetical protein
MPGFIFAEYDSPEANSINPTRNSKPASAFGPTNQQISAGAVVPLMINSAGTGFLLGTGVAPTAAFWSTVLTTMLAAPPAIGTTTPGTVRTSRPEVVYTDSTATPGNVTNNSPRGRVALAAGASTIVVTSSLVTATSAVFTNLRSVDGAATNINTVTTGAGSFTITFNGASTGTAAQVDFLVVN